ncbi:dicarboxylate/amino acid:cation symporter [Porphyromonas sp. COT-290 OH3588]|uniref:dicarboxylate/amino acid:cation symporter n=1 Tax=Porphyromonas sp. COT-290 OH3588 TaxID=1515617 RepID=UPI00052BC87A|nr:dicarboxylate/amino acid:cation symporter [Porphyromonas sp. COT-290 OH3588]KGO00158.1 sodium:proton antiporter [Porphyromonas sp. COT-290 OH3588]
MSKIPRIGLLGRILIAIVLGIGAGHIMPLFLVRLLVTFNSVFSEFLSFTIPLIIFALVASAISDVGRKAGRMLLLTTGIAYGSTIFAGYLAYFTGISVFPRLLEANSTESLRATAEGVAPYFTIQMPAVFGVMTALILAFILGLGMAHLDSRGLKSGIDELKEIISRLIGGVIIPLLPIYIFGIFSSMAYTGEVASTIEVFIRIIGVIFLLHIILLLLQFGIAGIICKRNPLSMLRNMMPAYFTALGTCSSAATIPVTLKQTQLNGVSSEVAGFTVPLCATIHLSGSTLKIVSCALALMIARGIPQDLGLFTEFILMLGVTMIAAPGVPGGAIMAALAIIQSILGFDAEQQALMISLYITMDNFGTACNVTGDGAIAQVVDQLNKREISPA